jgi:type III pantothenate kinase
MNLAIDIGNTSVKFGVFLQDELKEIVAQNTGLDEILSKYRIEKAIISASGVSAEIETKLKERKIETLLLSHQLKLPIELDYKTPETLGADRIAGSVAAHFLFPDTPVLKIDFGTCVTYDFIIHHKYKGGAISPGMKMRFKALHNYTAKLPLIDAVELTSYDLTGNDTYSSIISGVVNGVKEEVNGIIKEYEMRFGKLKVVATGGDSPLFVPLLKNEIFARPNLVLEGLNRVLNFNL